MWDNAGGGCGGYAAAKASPRRRLRLILPPADAFYATLTSLDEKLPESMSAKLHLSRAHFEGDFGMNLCPLERQQNRPKSCTLRPPYQASSAKTCHCLQKNVKKHAFFFEPPESQIWVAEWRPSATKNTSVTPYHDGFLNRNPFLGHRHRPF